MSGRGERTFMRRLSIITRPVAQQSKIDVPPNTPEEPYAKAREEELRDYVEEYLGALKVPPVWSLPALPGFLQLCLEDMRHRGWDEKFITDVIPALTVGAVLSITAYDHLDSVSAKIYIAVYTAIMTYLDDIANDNIDAVKAFSSKYQRNEPQGHFALQALVEVLEELPDYFGDGSRLIHTSSLNFVTALILEHDFPSLGAYRMASEYPKFIRSLSGIAQAYALFTFPPSTPWTSYIQILPYYLNYINYGNDVLSFYKEELAGEETNAISMVAQCENKDKLVIAKQIRQEALDGIDTASLLLKNQPELLASLDGFKSGYVHFHTALSRYKLKQLLCQA